MLYEYHSCYSSPGYAGDHPAYPLGPPLVSLREGRGEDMREREGRQKRKRAREGACFCFREKKGSAPKGVTWERGRGRGGGLVGL